MFRCSLRACVLHARLQFAWPTSVPVRPTPAARATTSAQQCPTPHASRPLADRPRRFAQVQFFEHLVHTVTTRPRLLNGQRHVRHNTHGAKVHSVNQLPARPLAMPIRIIASGRGRTFVQARVQA